MIQTRPFLRSIWQSSQRRTTLRNPRLYSTVTIEVTSPSQPPTITLTPKYPPTPPTASASNSETARRVALKKGGAAAILRTYTPRTPGIRHLRRPVNDHLWKGRPYYPLTVPKKGHGKGGRNNTGHVTVRHRGGGHKRRIRLLDFKRMDAGPRLVERIEYDPNRSAHIALLSQEADEGKKAFSYVIAAEGMRAGDVVESFRAGIPQRLIDEMGGVADPGMLAAKTAIRGNCLPMHLVPVGTKVYCVGSAADRGAVFCRSAGTYATVIAKGEEGTKEERTVVVRLQSGEVRRVSRNACATIGVSSNPHWHFRQLGKAGRARWLGIRPTVRGVAMNAGMSYRLFVSSDPSDHFVSIEVY
ncbi:ribosomal protein L2 [Eremomyces bilateralis CBS 781.70]|uniref:Large ribosomal subunit protein uL2m n=1 Tax=Eremomyces bilateralis CBS 781.70 TaxID=1392243 RepID=A0A6G1GHB1_9PEZI|nr:ribosomal protein L2 [Eremomyces bilateralis CBS 781.70]KAF1817259.1 ribosomal protein L2 [Eremomyces bilateralis CBS 781.70]